MLASRVTPSSHRFTRSERAINSVNTSSHVGVLQARSLRSFLKGSVPCTSPITRGAGSEATESFYCSVQHPVVDPAFCFKSRDGIVALLNSAGELLYRCTTDTSVRSLQPYFLFFFFSSHLLSSPFFSLSLLVVTQIRGHIAGSSPSSPLRFVPFIFIARRLQPFFPSSTRVELRLPTLDALSSSSCFFFCK